MTTLVAVPPPADAPARAAAVAVDRVARRFGEVEALCDVSLHVGAGEIHGLLGANGAGKTTLLRILAGLVEPGGGTVQLLGRPLDTSRAQRAAVGLVPSGDRSFYLRLSGLENLVFFARLHGLRRRAAVARSLEALAAVGLEDAARRTVNAYSHGMQKRLGFARALLGEPVVLLVDEATHDLDPVAARGIRELTRERVRAGAAVLWATQRVEELTGFADRVTVLQDGAVRFAGSPSALAAHARGTRHTLRLAQLPVLDHAALAAALDGMAVLEPPPDGDPAHVLLTLLPGVSLGSAIAVLAAAGADVLACREESPPIEAGFLSVTGTAS
jgi:ABC-2 type transport system ATP-binding protein